MDLIVEHTGDAPHRGRLSFSGRTVTCSLGRSGIYRIKHEGDGATPAGRFPLRRVLYRPDRLERPKTVLAVAPIAVDDGWCDEPADAQYNRPVKMPYRASAENMWRADSLYDIVVVIGHNDDPVVPGTGSAIFLHVTEDFGPTAGCVALTRAELLDVLAAIDAGTAIDIRS